MQIGGQAADIVLVVNNQRGLENCCATSSPWAARPRPRPGPVGRDATAATDIQMRAEILSYSRSRGLFAGISLKGAAIKEDQDSNNAFYGARYRSRDIAIDGKAAKPQAPDAVEALNMALDKLHQVARVSKAAAPPSEAVPRSAPRRRPFQPAAPALPASQGFSTEQSTPRARGRYLKRCCSFCSSALPGQSCSNGRFVSGPGTVPACACMSCESAAMYGEARRHFPLRPCASRIAA